MKPVLILSTCLLLLSGNLLLAQARFVTDGTIEYEKSVNTHAIYKKMYGNSTSTGLLAALDKYKQSHPQFKVLRSSLSFSGNKTLFEPIAGPEDKQAFMPIPIADQNNIIYTDFSAGTSITQKIVYDQTFLIKDNARKITWKITGETRDIAGYSCRRANGIMMDSIYVVAFYTIAIPVSGGPESFSGLPGMILGVALPHENVTWFATKVNAVSVPPLKVPAKGKAVNNKELRTTLESALRNRGSQLQNVLKLLLL